MHTDLILILVAVALLGAAWLFLRWLLALRFFIAAWSSGVPISVTDVVAMRMQRVPVELIVNQMIRAHGEGCSVSLEEMRRHHLAGGDVERVVSALIRAQAAGDELTFAEAARRDLDSALAR